MTTYHRRFTTTIKHWTRALHQTGADHPALVANTDRRHLGIRLVHYGLPVEIITDDQGALAVTYPTASNA
jgi:hypothetical protein